MTTLQESPSLDRQRQNWLRLRTFVFLRWSAITGQLVTLAVAEHILNLTIETALCYFVVGLSILTNIAAIFLYPENKRLSEREIFSIVLFDMLQLSVLLYLTGGLNNPFSILIIGPVMVSASALNTKSMLFLGSSTIIITSFLTEFFLPLRTASGNVLEIPSIFLTGNWVAIVIAVIFLGVYSRWIVTEIGSMSEALQATQMALAREQKLTDLGGVVAAAAHELGTPLATIKLTSTELASELRQMPELHEDAVLISDQADRCRDILQSMGRVGKDDLHMRRAPLTAVLEEAAEPHMNRGKDIIFDVSKDIEQAGVQPTIQRKPEIIHALRNLIQNAVDFAQDRVWIESDWNDKSITVRIMDDGEGYPLHMLNRLGEPFIRNRNPLPENIRPEYEGMGLGLFIAKTLLERSGAEVTFENGPVPHTETPHYAEVTGAVVQVSWPRARVEETRAARSALGSNTPLEV
ncbi:MAG: ActS/PrrB/RegB family redox-sensitive histidine kinase [Pseudomonadota bacterium]